MMTLSMTKIPKTLLLDFDGTLVDSMPVLEQAYYNFLAENNASGSAQGFAELIGSGLPEIIKRLKIKHNLQREADELYASYAKTLVDLYQNSILPCPGAQSLLEFASAEKIVTAIVTSAPRKLVQVCAQSLQWTKYLSHIFSADDVLLSKPHPDVYLAALEKTASPPVDALAIEDSINGIISAHAAQIPVIAINANNEDNKIFIEAGATMVVNSLNQVLDLFSQNKACTIFA
jgi:beta-phosphoglucomutase